MRKKERRKGQAEKRRGEEETHFSVIIDLEPAGARVERGCLGDVVVLALALLLLELERDAAHGPALDALHQMRREPGDFVAQAFRGDDGLHTQPAHATNIHRNEGERKAIGGERQSISTRI